MPSMEDFLSEALQSHETPIESVEELREIVSRLPSDSRGGNRQQILNATDEVLELMLKLVNFEIADRDRCGIVIPHASDEESKEGEGDKRRDGGWKTTASPGFAGQQDGLVRQAPENSKTCVVCGAPDCKHTCPCKQALYCGQECQREHWGRHKKTCSVALAKKATTTTTTSTTTTQQQQQHSHLRFRPTAGGGNAAHGHGSSRTESKNRRTGSSTDDDDDGAVHHRGMQEKHANINNNNNNNNNNTNNNTNTKSSISSSNSSSSRLALEPEYSKWLWRSSWMHSISCLVALSVPVYDCALPPGIVLITSLNYWRKPDYGWRRSADIVCVQFGLWWQVIRNIDAQEPNRTIAFAITTIMIVTFWASVKVSERNVQLSTFLHALVHLLGNVSSIIMYCGNLPDYREAWFALRE